jgi:hypothetical protein
MATYLELWDQNRDNDDLRKRTAVAVAIAAHALSTTGTPTDDDHAWIGKALNDPDGEARKALYFVLAANKDATVAQIEAATDATLQTNVDSVRTSLVAAYKQERTATAGG